MAISFSSCFAGGAFLGACLLDLLPEVEEIFEAVMAETGRDYPLAQLTIGCGFLIILLIEQTVVKFQERWQKEEQDQEGSHHQTAGGAGGEGDLRGNASGEKADECNGCSYSSMEQQPLLLAEQSGQNNEDNDGFHHSHLPSGTGHSAFRSLMLLFALSFHR